MSSRPRVLVTGADGQVGRALLSQFANTSELIACNRQALDLSNPDQIRSKVRDARPDIILNARPFYSGDDGGRGGFRSRGRPSPPPL